MSKQTLEAVWSYNIVSLLPCCPRARHWPLAPSGYKDFCQSTKWAKSCCHTTEQSWRAPCVCVLVRVQICVCRYVCTKVHMMICVSGCVHAGICEYLCIYLCVCVWTISCLLSRQGFFLSSANKQRGCQSSQRSHRRDPLWDRLTMWIFKYKIARCSAPVNYLICLWFKSVYVIRFCRIWRVCTGCGYFTWLICIICQYRNIKTFICKNVWCINPSLVKKM